MAEPKRDTNLKLEDVLNYKPPQRISDEDIDLIRATFKNNDKLLHAIQRILLPSILDGETPAEFMGTDRWMDLDFALMPTEEVKPIVLARQYAIKYVCGGLVQLKVLANQPISDVADRAMKRNLDSVK